MTYREGRVSDMPAITKMLGESNYYLPTNAAEIGGRWVVAEHDNEIVGFIWAFAAGVQAYVDYWYVHPRWRKTRVPARLVAIMQANLQAAGTRFVRGVMRSENLDATRLAAGFGVALDHGYALAYKELQ